MEKLYKKGLLSLRRSVYILEGRGTKWIKVTIPYLGYFYGEPENAFTLCPPKWRETVSEREKKKDVVGWNAFHYVVLYPILF